MGISSPQQRLEFALQEPQPARPVLELARALKADGMTQVEMYQLYDEFRAKHQNDADETRYDAILDAMDHIAGWCAIESQLFDTELQA